MNDGAAGERPGARSEDQIRARIGGRSGGVRLALVVLAPLVLVLALVPPLALEARRVEALEALQFALLAMAVPALVALGTPWRRLGLASGPTGAADAEGVCVVDRPLVADRVAAARRRHPGPARGVAWLLLEMAAVVAWRVPVSVDALARHGWLSVVEALTLVVAGTGLWLELVASPPLAPRLARPQRMALAAVAMWTVWVTAYLVGLSHASVYRAFPHVAGRDLSVAADQAIATWVLWFTSLCAFLPVIFSNLVIWLRGDDDADEALYRLVRDGRRRSGPLLGGGGPEVAGGRPTSTG
ncbi:MAG TPA: cytochrome c oxidase assembly protein [Acidimicrobiales bacterium]|nr:cytochrome c oxidase assembly protein [Acidimicrobiales bacterium]